MNDKNSDELYRLAESENGGKDTGEFLERESRRYSRRLDEEEEAKSR
jgi:archaellum biogenesis protein FlaJ (TadC family)